MPGVRNRPDGAGAERVLRTALQFGINLFDTAPGYGHAEELLGRALADAPDCLVCTKVPIPVDPSGALLGGPTLATAVRASIRESLRRLRRDRIDLVQIHNATVEVLRRGDLAGELVRARDAGHVRSLGVSVYTLEEARTALHDGSFDVLQVPYSLLDQRMAEGIFAEAARSGVGIITRSALLKGALTPRARLLPPGLDSLRGAVEQVREALQVPWSELPFLALRFCLSTPSIGTTLVGVRDLAELEDALNAAGAAPLRGEELEAARRVFVRDPKLLDPRGWPLL